MIHSSEGNCVAYQRNSRAAFAGQQTIETALTEGRVLIYTLGREPAAPHCAAGLERGERDLVDLADVATQRVGAAEVVEGCTIHLSDTQPRRPRNSASILQVQMKLAEEKTGSGFPSKVVIQAGHSPRPSDAMSMMLK